MSKGKSGRVEKKNRHGSVAARLRNTLRRKLKNVLRSNGESAAAAYATLHHREMV